MIQYSIVEKVAEPAFQFIVMRVGNTYIATTYITPNISRSAFQKCLTRIQQLVIGKGIIMGDLNCRHTRWDKKSNTQGKWLVQWAAANNWAIHAPNEHTFSSHRGSSTVDLFLSTGVDLQNTSVLHGTWDGCSDHLPVTAEIGVDPPYRVPTSFIPHRQRTNPSYTRKATDLYKTSLPKIIDLVQRASTMTELEEIYDQLKEVTLEPWEPSRRNRPGRFKYFWNQQLEHLKRRRSKKYRAAAKLRTQKAWDEYKMIDRRIRYLVKKRKAKFLSHTTEALLGEDQRDGLKSIKSILRRSSESTTGSSESPGELDPSAFTLHLATPSEQRHVPETCPIQVTPALLSTVETAIRTSKRNKASGADELFTEAFQLAPKLFAQIICQLWAKCSEHNSLLLDWRLAQMVPIYKRGEKSDPSSYRPIALLSHGRQMVSYAIGKMIRNDCQFHPTQLGFRERTGTETAIIRHAHSYESGYKFTAVLDLKSAYDSVPRDILMNRVRQKLSKGTADMIALELQPMTIATKGDTSGTTAKVYIGVPQGGKSSPPLYNVHMDGYGEKVESEAPEVRASMFADDVKLQAKDPEALQKALDVSSTWAEENRMTWNVKKCHILEPESTKTPGEYYLSGQRMKVSDSAEYLGVTLRNSALAVDRNLDRVKAANQRLGMLKAAGINRKYVPSSKLVNICRAFVYPVADYAIHLMPMEAQGSCALGRELELLDYRVVEYALGCIQKDPVTRRNGNSRIKGRLPRHLKMAKIPDWLQRIRMRLRSLARRLSKRARTRGVDALARDDALNFIKFREQNKSPRDLSKKDLLVQWQLLCRGRRRGIPIPEKGHLPILKERDSKVRDAGIRWYTGTFPGASGGIEMSLGSERYRRAKNWLEVGLREKEWNRGVRRRTLEGLKLIMQAMDVPSEESDVLRASSRKRRRVAGVPGARKRRKGK